MTNELQQIAKRAAEFIRNTDPFGDHFGQRDLEILAGEYETRQAARLAEARQADADERKRDAYQECHRRGIDPDEVCADGGVLAWMVVDKEMQAEGSAS